MKKTMKKLTAVLLAAVLTVGFSLTAFAADSDLTPSTAGTFTFTKEYTSTDNATFPTETLEFTVTADTNNPDGGTALIKVGDDNTFDIAGTKTTDIVVNYPSYSKAGVYRYTIKEKEGSSQGVTYDTTKEIKVAVLVTYNDAHTALVVEDGNVGVEKTNPDAVKEDTITNVYEFGGDQDEDPKTKGLTVKKTVTGNLGDQSKLFTIKVTLQTEADKYVNSDIEVSGGSYAGNTQTITKGWTGTKEITIKLKHDETVQFNKIPVGVTYTVEEDPSHIAAGEVQTPEELNGDEGYLVTYDNEEGTIAKDVTQEASVTNDKNTEIHTGISLDSLPYLMMLAAVAIGVFVIFRLRRIEE